MPISPVIHNATVIKRIDLTDTLVIFRVKPDEPMDSFLPGQYTVLGLNHEEKGPVLRAYSIASPPHFHGEYFEYFVRYVSKPASDNPLTHLLFKLKEGDRIHMRPRCKGKFTLESCLSEDDKRLRLFVAAGTGLAPFYSMVMEEVHRTGGSGNQALFHGVSFVSDLGYREELESVMNKGDRKLYHPTISRPQPEDNWTGMTGRVESHFSPEKIENTEKALGLGDGELNAKNCTIMICGLQGTIAVTMMHALRRGFIPEDRKVRRALGIPKETAPSLFWEQYDADPIIDLKNEELLEDLRGRLTTAGVELEAPPS